MLNKVLQSDNLTILQSYRELCIEYKKKKNILRIYGCCVCFKVMLMQMAFISANS